MRRKTVLTNRSLSINALCFLLGVLGAYLVLGYAGYLSTGDYSLICGDLKENYIPAIRNICRDIRNGDNIFYSWLYGMGTNVSLYNAYYAYSPLNLIYLIFYNSDINKITILNILIKIGLSSICFRIYVSKSYNISDFTSVVSALFYSLCSFQFVYNTQNIIWLDAMYALPMVFWGINRLFALKKPGVLIFWYTYIFFAQFYMGYMIGIVSVIYFVLCVLVNANDETRKTNRRVIGVYIFAVLVSIGLSAITWFPALLYLLDNTASTITEFESSGINLIDIANQLFWGQVSDYDATFPYIYCGVASIFLLPSFFCSRKHPIRLRVGYAILLVALVSSCLITPLYALWHGFDFPNSYGYRFSYLITFVICTINAIQLDEEANVSKKTFFYITGGAVIIYSLSLFWQHKRFDDSVISNSICNGMVNLALFVTWMLFYTNKTKIKSKYKRALMMVMLLITMIELVSNGYMMIEGRDRGGKKLSKEAYYAWEDNSLSISKELAKDDTMYRVCTYQDIGISTGMLYGYKTISFFGSSENIKLRNVLGYLGLWNSPRIVRNYGLTDITKLLLGIKYDAYGDVKYTDDLNNVYYQSEVVLREQNLGIGFLVEGQIDDYIFRSTQAIENINDLVALMTGEDIRIFWPIDTDMILYEEEGLHIEDATNGKIIYPTGAYESPYCRFILDCDDSGDFYVHIDNDSSYYTKETYFLLGGDENYLDPCGAMTIPYIKQLVTMDGKPTLTIASRGYMGTQTFKEIYFYFASNDELVAAYNILKQNVLDVDECANGYIKGSIDGTKEQKLLFTSIPYEKGWRAWVDGNEVEITPLLYDTLIALPITGEGKHVVELKFIAPGLMCGVLISTISIVILSLGYIKRMV